MLVRNSIRKIINCSLVAATVAMFGCKDQPANNHSTKQTPFASTVLPADNKSIAALSQASFSNMFVSGAVSLNGQVKPANSVAFCGTCGQNTDSNFYAWAEQMFLWITSPANSSGQYTPGNTVLESSIFYTVSPDTTGNSSRILVPHRPHTLLRAVTSISQRGGHNLPVVHDTKGNAFEVEKHDFRGTDVPMVKNKEGKDVEVSEVTVDGNGVATFLDKNKKQIASPSVVSHHRGDNSTIVQAFLNNKGKYTYLKSAAGNDTTNVVTINENEIGQAGSSAALMANGGSLVYYILFVNDVFAYYLTGVKNHDDSLKYHLNGNQFPTTAAEMNNICTYARNNFQTTLSDSNALAMELKTSWVDAATLPDGGASYVTIMAVVTKYKANANGSYMLPSGDTTLKLALIGMHVVGSMNGHPEMNWATFEHKSNAPNVQYPYLTAAGQISYAVDTTPNWLLNSCATLGTTTPNNVKYMLVGGNDSIIATVGNTFAPSNTWRYQPWGSSVDTNLADLVNSKDNIAKRNSQIISMNQAVIGMLAPGDVRKNYLLIGATWTTGVAPSTYSDHTGITHKKGDALGTNQLENSTMETYSAAPGFNVQFNSCLSCHTDTLSPFGLEGQFTGLTHIFSAIHPLPVAPAATRGK